MAPLSHDDFLGGGNYGHNHYGGDNHSLNPRGGGNDGHS